MDERQARLLIQQAFREQGLTGEIIKGVNPNLIEALRRTAAQIRRTLPPPGDLMRERAWRQLRPRLYADLDRFANELGAATMSALKDEVNQAEKVAAGFLVGEKTNPASLTRSGNVSSLRGAAAFEAVWQGADITVTSGELYFKALSRTGVAGQSFREIFGVSIDPTGGILTVGEQRTGLSRFFVTSIDRLVSRGILEGRDTADIAHDLVFDSIKSGLNLGKTGRQLRTNAFTVVRTAIAEANARMHEAFWDENDEVIEGWVFDALSDSRTCPWCAMNDQKEAKDRNDLPKVPLHPRCRCQVLPITAAAKLLREEDKKEGNLPGGSAVEVYTESELRDKFKVPANETTKDFLKRRGGKGDRDQLRIYRTPFKQNGRTFYRVARDLPATGASGILKVPEWLATANATTRIQFFGGGNPGRIRNEIFERRVKDGDSPRSALNALLSRDEALTRRSHMLRWKPAAKLRK